MKKNNCTETCKGIIKEIKIKGIDFLNLSIESRQ